MSSLLTNHEHTTFDRLCIVVGYVLSGVGAFGFAFGLLSQLASVTFVSLGAIVLGVLVGRSHKILLFLHDMLG